MCLISSFTLGNRLAAPAWIPLYQDWAIAGSFARRNTEFFLLAEMTSKYLEATDEGLDEERSEDTKWREDRSLRHLQKEHLHNSSFTVPVFCVRGALFSWHLAHLQGDDARLLHLSWQRLSALLWSGRGRVPWQASAGSPRTFKEGRHLLDVLHWSREEQEQGTEGDG